MVADHEVPGYHTCPLLACDESERVGLRAQPSASIEQVVLQVGAELDRASDAVVTLCQLATIASDEGLLQVISLDRSTPQGAYGYRALLGNGHLRNILIGELYRPVLLVTGCNLGDSSTAPVAGISRDDSEELIYPIGIHHRLRDLTNQIAPGHVHITPFGPTSHE